MPYTPIHPSSTSIPFAIYTYIPCETLGIAKLSFIITVFATLDAFGHCQAGSWPTVEGYCKAVLEIEQGDLHSWLQVP